MAQSQELREKIREILDKLEYQLINLPLVAGVDKIPDGKLPALPNVEPLEGGRVTGKQAINKMCSKIDELIQVYNQLKECGEKMILINILLFIIILILLSK